VLQSVAVCRSVLQCSWCLEHNDDVEGASEFVAVRCSVLQYVPVCGSVWQCVAVCGSVWQCVAVRGSVLQQSHQYST